MCTGLWWENLRGKVHFRRPRHRCENNKKMGLQEMRWGGGEGGMNWNDPAKDRDNCRALVNAVMYLRVP